MSEGEDEADDKGEEGSAGAETVPGVTPADHNHWDDGGGDPAQRSDAHTNNIKYFIEENQDVFQ